MNKQTFTRLCKEIDKNTPSDQNHITDYLYTLIKLGYGESVRKEFSDYLLKLTLEAVTQD